MSDRAGSVEQLELRPGSYHDSVTLMRVSSAAAGTPGVLAAQVAMATELNVELTRGLGFTVPDDAGPQQLIVALRAEDDAALQAGLAAVEAALAARTQRTTTGDTARPRTVRAAASRSDAPLVLLSVPGPAVLGEALDALDAGRHLMIFSDNVPVADEVLLKQRAAASGLLVMGPDCGTAVVAGVGLGFANVLSGTGSGPRVGIVAASGTGAQQLSCLLDTAGVTVSHVLGLGGRDLSAAVGGLSADTALGMLDDDPGTDHVVLVSKPPDPATAERVLSAARARATPVSTVLLGAGNPDITAAAEDLLRALGVAVPSWPSWGAVPPPGPAGALRGLYAGGTLADEAMIVAEPVLGPLASNIPLRPELALPAAAVRGGAVDLTGLGHAVVDLGDDLFTRGRPHPMIDPGPRLQLLAAQAADPAVRVVLLDVVLGHGADPDPAATLAPAIAAAAGRSGPPLAVVVALVGTAGDPQDLQRQARLLADAGARVFASNAAAARSAAGLAAGPDAPGGPS